MSFAASDTEAVFGQVIHTYDMLQSRKDHSTVPIYYDPQLIKLKLTNEKINAELQEILEETGSDASQAERARWAAVAEAAGTKERIAELAAKLLDHFQKRNAMINGKAMVVCMSRRNCARLYDALVGAARLPREVKIVMTGNLSEDPPEWSATGHITTKPQRDAIKARMKDIDDPLKIVIVRDMWLTGTDIPCLHIAVFRLTVVQATVDGFHSPAFWRTLTPAGADPYSPHYWGLPRDWGRETGRGIFGPVFPLM